MEKFIHELFNDEIARKCSEKYNHDVNSLQALGGFESFIYEYSYHEKKYILRITHNSHRSEQLIEAELHFIYYLYENGSNVARPVFSKENKLTEKIEIDEESHFIVTSFEKAEGSHLRFDQLSSELIEKWGMTIGHFHKLAKEYIPGKYKRFEWVNDGLYLNIAQFIPEEQTIVIEKTNNQIKKINGFKKDKSGYGLIHTDIHSGNFFVHNSEMTVFDFDDCAYNYFASDIAIALFSTVFNKKIEDKNEFATMYFHHFMNGYHKQNQLDQQWIIKIPDFIKLREMVLYAAIYRSLDTNNLPPWPALFMEGRRNSIENELNILDLSIFK
ncbi:MAG: phosphotransferase [Clostridia bacterium]|nr:phosphotransferase [Clostridia bacterium]